MISHKAIANILIAVTAATFIASCFRENPAVLDNFKVINCQTLSNEDFGEEIKAEAAKGVVRADSGKPATKILFDLDDAANQDVTVSIYTDRAGPAPLYHGKLTRSIEVHPANELFREMEGKDNMHFTFFDAKRLRVCSQMQDSSAVYWQEGKNIKIEFLQSKELDPEIGTPIGHRVHLQ